MRWTLRERLFTSKRSRQLQEAEANWAKANGFSDDASTRAAMAHFKKSFRRSVVTEDAARSLVAVHLFSQTSVAMLAGRYRSNVVREPEYLGFNLARILEPRFGNDSAPLIFSLGRNATPDGHRSYRDDFILDAAEAVAGLPPEVTADDILAGLPKIPVSTLVDALTHGIPLEYAEAMNQLASA